MQIKTNKHIILASQSPRRKKLLEQIGLSFTVVHSGFDEEAVNSTATPREHARLLALGKARDVAARFDGDYIVIGADTIVVLDGEILNKPKSPEQASEMLNKLSGRTHTVFTGIALIDCAARKEITDVQATEVTFRRLGQSEIDEYIAGGSPMDKAGSYGIQDDYGAVFVSRIVGCYYNIVGLPLEMVFSKLKELTE